MPSNVGYQLLMIEKMLKNASRVTMPYTSDDLMGSAAINKLVTQIGNKNDLKEA